MSYWEVVTIVALLTSSMLREPRYLHFSLLFQMMRMISASLRLYTWKKLLSCTLVFWRRLGLTPWCIIKLLMYWHKRANSGLFSTGTTILIPHRLYRTFCWLQGKHLGQSPLGIRMFLQCLGGKALRRHSFVWFHSNSNYADEQGDILDSTRRMRCAQMQMTHGAKWLYTCCEFSFRKIAGEWCYSDVLSVVMQAAQKK